MLAAFAAAGIAQSRMDWIVGNWLPEGVEVDATDICRSARPAEVHSHFFTANGRFGSRDSGGQQVDDGDYLLVDADTLSFPSHATEFGYDSDILVDYAVTGEAATFDVRIPPNCTDACLDAYAWALSAFYGADPWSRN